MKTIMVLAVMFCSFSAYSHSIENHFGSRENCIIETERVRNIYGDSSIIESLSNVMAYKRGIAIINDRYFLHYHHSLGEETIEISKFAFFDFLCNADYSLDIFPSLDPGQNLNVYDE